MTGWRATVEVQPRQVKVLVTDWRGDVLRARLGRPACHPRALLTLLEGIALWSGARLSVALRVAPEADEGWIGEPDGSWLWPEDSALVQFRFAESHRLSRLRGLGSFRDLLRVHDGRR
jgi:hypothetical protein